MLVLMEMLLLLRFFFFFFASSNFAGTFCRFAECFYGYWMDPLCGCTVRVVAAARGSRPNKMKKNQTEKYYLLEFFLLFFFASTFDNDSMLGVGNGNVRQVWRIVNLSVCIKQQCSRVPAITGVQWCFAYHIVHWYIYRDDLARHLSITAAVFSRFFYSTRKFRFFTTQWL